MATVHRTAACFGLLATFLLILTACREGADGGAESNSSSEPRSVVITTATARNLERTVTVFGSFLAQEQATLSTKVPGRLREIQVDIGTAVTRGEIISRIEPRDYEMRVRQADAALAQALARLGLAPEDEDQEIEPDQTSLVRQAQAVLDEARANGERIARLQREGVLSQSELDTAKAALTIAENRYQDAVEEVRQRIALVAQRRIERDIAAQQLTDTTLTAPFDATVQDRRASPGEFLASGAPVVTLIQMNPLRLRLEVTEREAHLIRLGQTARARVEGLPGEYVGPIKRVSPGIDPLRRMLIVEADIINDGKLHPGMFARAEIVVNAAEPAVTVTTDSLLVFAGIEKVFTIVEGRVQERVVITGRQAGEWVEVVTNLNAGELIIRNPGNLQNGEAVVPSTQTAPAATQSLPRPDGPDTTSS